MLLALNTESINTKVKLVICQKRMSVPWIQIHSMYYSTENNPLQGLPFAVLHPHVLLMNSMHFDVSVDCLISHGQFPVVLSLLMMHKTYGTDGGCGHGTGLSVDN